MVIIKRYPNRKLYNTEAKQYITLDGIAELIRSGQEVQVTDHATGEDLTALTLTQIILEHEKNQTGLLSNSFLTSLIRAGEDRLTSLQRVLSTPGTLLRQIDEEIQKRVQSLVSQGQMSEKEGKSLLEKLMEQGRALREHGHSDGMGVEAVESYLRQRDIPTQADLQRLYAQLDELTSKLEQLAQPNEPPAAPPAADSAAPANLDAPTA
jgi:polyhydroxyalkanoate synthesis repressor PhaR